MDIKNFNFGLSPAAGMMVNDVIAIGMYLNFIYDKTMYSNVPETTATGIGGPPFPEGPQSHYRPV